MPSNPPQMLSGTRLSYEQVKKGHFNDLHHDGFQSELKIQESLGHLPYPSNQTTFINCARPFFSPIKQIFMFMNSLRGMYNSHRNIQEKLIYKL